MTRFTPVRAGIVNLYEYGDQTFEFADGRLLLRGHNTSGKTKALELLFPFCLDGDISPAKLDPFAGTAKEMKWNLVGCVPQDQRVGYVWIEFARPDGQGGTERVTAGIGMKAWRERPGVKRWYWLLRGRRVGVDVELVREDREPCSRADLAARIGDDGELLDSATDYRERLRQVVFGFASADEYRVMLELMRSLRRPHLSKSLDPAGVAAMLSAGLPGVDEGLLRRLGGGLEQLEALEARLARARGTRMRLQGFHDRTYRAYGQALVRERGQALRSADAAARGAADELRTADAAAEARAEEERKLERAQEERREQERRTDGEERALVTSAAWQSVAELAQLGARAQEARSAAAARRDEAAAAVADVVVGEADLALSTATLAEAERGVAERLDETDTVARGAGLAARAVALREALSAGMVPATWRDELHALAQGTKAVLTRHGELRRARRAAEVSANHARAALTAAAERLAGARAAREAGEEAVAAEREARAQAITSWAEGLEELEVTPEELVSLERAGAAAEPIEPLLAVASGRVRAHLAAARSDAEARAAALDQRRDELQAEQDALQADHDEPPASPAWSRTSRDGRPGAPLWRVTELRGDVSPADRAVIEAALHAAGLLDAWLTTDGTLLAAGTLDTVLAPDTCTPLTQTTLEAVLDADGTTDVPVDAVRRVLAAIAYGSTAAATGAEVAIGADGSFVLGPLRGRSAKAEAEFLGAGARAARRARRLAEVADVLVTLAEDRRRIEDRLAAVVQRGAALDAELAGFPAAAELEAALRRLGVALAAEATTRTEHEQTEAEAARRADALVAAQAAQREHAAEHGLPPDLDDAAIGARREACAELSALVRGVERELEALSLAFERLASRREHQVRTAERAGERERQATAAEDHATRLAAEHAGRESALGEEGATLRARHAVVVAQLTALRAALRDGAQALAAAHDAARDAQQDRVAAQLRRDTTRERRELALKDVRALASGGLLATALGADAPEDVDRVAAWPLTRALELARALPEPLVRVQTPSGELAQRVTRALLDLGRELAEADLGVYTSSHDGVVVVHVTEGPSDRTLDEVLRSLELDIAERERLLSAEERRVFGATLVEELADHLRVRIRAVHDRVRRMNAILARCPTASGKVIKLAWEVEDEHELGSMVQLLRRAIAGAGPEERDRLVEFFRARIEAARADVPLGGAEAMVQTLAGAFDYRTWHRFDLLQEHNGVSERLTRKRHAVGSGGEQAVLIHLPLFAAAAALYDDTTAPRLIMLDEALSGIDDETRERVLKATVDFQLDLVMTSHELWGAYVTVPALSIYQLHRDNDAPGVHAIQFRWEGAVLRELEQGELLVA